MIDPEGQGGSGGAYQWAQQPGHLTVPPIPEAKKPSRSGIDGALDEAVQWTLEKTGALTWLEKVSGAPEQLSAAAKVWQAQAQEMQNAADDLRTGARPLSENWQGQASDAFAGHMGRIVQAMDATAEDMAQTAGILGQAAAECALAEETVIHLITELIDLLIGMLATSLILDLVTAGLATVVDALASEAAVAAYLVRIEKVSVELAKTLRELQKAVKELKEAQRAGRSVKDLISEADDVRKASGTLRRTGGLMNYRNVENRRDWLAHHIVSGQIDKHTLGLAERELGMNDDVKEPLIEFGTSKIGRQAVAGDGSEAPAPYRVDPSRVDPTRVDPTRIEEAFS